MNMRTKSNDEEEKEKEGKEHYKNKVLCRCINVDNY